MMHQSTFQGSTVMYSYNSNSEPSWVSYQQLRRLQVLAMGYNRKPHKRWTGWVLEDDAEYLVMYRPPQATVLIHDQDTWSSAVPAICVFWPTRSFELIYLLDAEAHLQGYHVNLITRLVRRPGYLEYVDLNLGLVVGPDLGYTVDSEERAASYPDEVQAQAHAAFQEAIAMIESRDPLFAPPTRWLEALDNSERNTLDEIAAMLK
jgi:protein associated with RNAse G/E